MAGSVRRRAPSLAGYGVASSSICANEVPAAPYAVSYLVVDLAKLCVGMRLYSLIVDRQLIHGRREQLDRLFVEALAN
jgi:hypothetical protein